MSELCNVSDGHEWKFPCACQVSMNSTRQVAHEKLVNEFEGSFFIACRHACGKSVGWRQRVDDRVRDRTLLRSDAKFMNCDRSFGRSQNHYTAQSIRVARSLIRIVSQTVLSHRFSLQKYLGRSETQNGDLRVLS